MLVQPIVNTFLWTFNNYGTNPSATPGTSVVPGINNAEGSWTQVATAANIATEVYGIHVFVAGGNTSGIIKNHLLDIGIDPAGGTAYTELIGNILCGQSNTASLGSCQFFFPIKIPAGASVAVRVQGNNGTSGTVRVGIKFYGKPSNPELVIRGEETETIGSIGANSSGVVFTPGNAADGAWQSLGSTTKDIIHLNLCAGVNNGVITAQYTWVDLAFGDASNKHIVISRKTLAFTTTTEILVEAYASHLTEGYCHIPAGSTLYVRGRCSTAPVSGYQAIAVGVVG